MPASAGMTDEVMLMSAYVLIPLLPLVAFLTLALGGRCVGENSHKIAIPAIGLSFGLSIGAFIEVVRNGAISIPLYRFIQSGSLVVDLGLEGGVVSGELIEPILELIAVRGGTRLYRH